MNYNRFYVPLRPIFRGEYQIMQNQDVLNVMNSLGIIGRSPQLMQALNAAVQAAPFDVNVLIVGENGVGKEVFHKILHNGSHRRHSKCVAVNCGGLPEGTIDSELFGHVKGAYTGAIGDRKGYFEEADGGTIFLDEVGDLPMAIQAKLLRVLEKGEFLRMGSNEVRKTNVRVVAATNVDLHKAIQQGKFREDLYYRLSTITIQVPPLRERQEDILLLFRKFANETANKYRMTSGIQLTDDAKQLLLAYQWPGNVRQLLHIVEEISIVEMDRLINAETLQHYLPRFTSGVSVGGGSTNNEQTGFGPGEKEFLYKLIFDMRGQLDEIRSRLGMRNTAATPRPIRSIEAGSTIVTTHDVTNPLISGSKAMEVVEEVVPEEWPNGNDPIEETPTLGGTKAMSMADIEKQAIQAALARNNGSKRKAAEELQISERTIHRKIQEYGLDR